MAASSRPRTPAALEQLLTDCAPDLSDIVLRMRVVILARLPDASEKVYLGWRAVGFRDSHGGDVCAVLPRVDGVRVCFENRDSRDDDAYFLIGSWARFITVVEWNDGLPALIADLIDQAVHRDDRRYAPCPV